MDETDAHMAQANSNLLLSEVAHALDEPDTEAGRLRDLLARCSSALEDVLAQNKRICSDARDQITEIAAMIDREEVTWPEDVARHEALTNEIRQRAELFARG